MDPRNRLPWIVAAVAMLFAVIVLIRSEVSLSIENRNKERNGSEEYPFAQSPYDGQRSQRPWQPMYTPLPNAVNSTPAVPTPAAEIIPDLPPPKEMAQLPVETPKPVPIPDNTLNGLIVNDDFQPIPKAFVRLVATSETSGAIEMSAVSDNDGKFSIKKIASDKVEKIVIEARGYAASLVEPFSFPISDELQIVMNALSGIDVSVMDLSAGVSSGKLYSGELEVSLSMKKNENPSSDTYGISQPAITSGSFSPVRNQQVKVENGEFHFDSVEPGEYKVRGRSGKLVAESEPFTVENGKRSSATLELGLQQTVRGNIVSEKDGLPVLRALIALAPSVNGNSSFASPDYMGFSDDTGVFTLPEIQPGKYTLTVSANGYTTKSVDNVEVSPWIEPEPTSVTLFVQQPLITVQVLNVEGTPIPSSPLVLMSGDSSPVKTWFGNTDEAGLYRFENLLAGKYTVSVTDPSDRTRRRSASLELKDAQTLEITLRFGPRVKVTGKATQNEKDFEGSLLFTPIGFTGGDVLQKTDKTGSYAIELEPGDYMAGTVEKPNQIHLKIGGTQTQTVNLDFKQ